MFYLFHGDDTHSQQETLAQLQAKLGDPAMLDLNTTRFEGLASFSELWQACSAVPFLAKVRLIIVNDFFLAQPDKSFIDELVSHLPRLPETTRLIFLESRALRANHPVLKLAQQDERGYVRLFNRPQGQALEQWIRQQTAQKRGRISPRAVHMLATNIGNDLQVLDNELEKLVLYKGDDGEIDERDVARLSPYAAEASIFDLVDALGTRNGRQAALLLEQKLAEGADPFYLFAMFMRQFRLLIQVKEMADAGSRPPAISQQLKLHNYVAGKLYQQSQSFNLAQLEQIYSHLLDIDVGVKIGRNDMTTALSLLVAGLTLEQ